jgi:acyl-CoA thioesterase
LNTFLGSRENDLNNLAALGDTFSGRVGVEVVERGRGSGRCRLQLAPWLFNPHGVVHGGVLFTLVDTCMGVALYPTLEPDQLCATIDIQISYLNPVTEGPLQCTAELIKRGKRVAHLYARVSVADTVVATATGNFAIFQRKPQAILARAGQSASAQDAAK